MSGVWCSNTNATHDLSTGSVRAAAFEHDGVAPAAVELADAFADADGAEALGAVHGDARPVLREDRGLQGPQAAGVGGGDGVPQQGGTGAHAPGHRST